MTTSSPRQPIFTSPAMYADSTRRLTPDDAEISIVGCVMPRDTWPATGLAAGSILTTAVGPGPVSARIAAAVLAPGLGALVVRRSRPLLVLIAVSGVVVGQTAFLPQANPAAAFVALILVAYSLGRMTTGRALWAGLALAVGTVAGAHSLAGASDYSSLAALAFLLPTLVLLPAAVGRMGRWRAAILEELHVTSRLVSATREERLSAEVRERRLAIAADVDRVVATGLADLRRYDLSAGLSAVTALENSARQTLVEVRGLLAALREPCGDGGPDADPGKQRDDLRRRVRAVLAEEATGGHGVSATSRGLYRWALPSTLEVDIALAGLGAIIFVGCAVEVARAASLTPSARVAGCVLAILLSGGIAFARRVPAVAGLAIAGSLVAWAALSITDDPLGGFSVIGLFCVAPFALAGYRRRALAVCALSLCLATAATLPWVNPNARFRAVEVAPALGIIAVCWVAGRTLIGQHRLVATLAGQLGELAVERNLLAESLLHVERSRLTLDLHDAVAHCLTVIVLQATAARRVWSSDPQLAAEHVDQLTAAVDDAVHQLRPIVMTLRLGSADKENALTDLPALSGWARLAGIRLQTSWPDEFESASVPVEVAAHAYRIVQESLTNAVRHAPGSDVRIDVHIEEGAVRIEVVNGPSADARDASLLGSGRGLTGMQLRARQCGGWLTSGPRADGGFGVQALLPLGEPA